ncbi:Dehydration-responsive element-binding protein 1D [Abeliophyllum distichum]|uniref:Dehydration-responsive element-binding protein 1D n=1 Tax=Abeliophyllum distichum TaxID=126358 RepID=A0ABD1UQB4_9LAMI
MDIFSNNYSDPLFSVQDFSSSTETLESSSLSDNGISRTKFSDEEVLLASNNPKKRAGRKKFREMRHPVYRGVRRRNSGKWVCEVRVPNKKSRIWLGTFPTVEMAARAHDVAAIALRGRSACLNFADSAWKLPVPASTDAKDIQKAAAEAAKAFGKPSSESDKREEAVAISPENVFFTDDEALFGMPGLIQNMAEGLMLPPPYCMDTDDVEAYADVSLWSYSI